MRPAMSLSLSIGMGMEPAGWLGDAGVGVTAASRDEDEGDAVNKGVKNHDKQHMTEAIPEIVTRGHRLPKISHFLRPCMHRIKNTQIIPLLKISRFSNSLNINSRGIQ